MIARSRHAASLAAAACGGTSSAARSYVGLDLLLQENFSAPRRVLQLHALLLTSGALSLPHPDPAATAAFPYNCLIHAHLRLRGSASPPWGPLRIFSAMLARGVRPNRHTFPSLLKSSASFDAATPTLHAQCLRRGLDEDRFVACSLLSAYGRDGHLVRDARKVFDDMASPDLATCNAMLDVLCLSGDMYGARCLFDRMVVRDVVSWTTIISGLTRIGCHWDAVEMFRAFLLQNKGRLSEATLVSVLSACANLDAVEGLAVGMAVHGHVVRHEVQFTAFLGTALIDMYGRAGRFLEAIQIIERMPFMADDSVWGALLGACKIHGNIELSAQIREKLIVLGGQQPGRYVTVRNMYLEEGNWYAATRMGEVMQEAGIKKIVGMSSVVLN
uniref:Pentatricopeptide n=1 Tax=Oryza rufipogon TaxID=4529 RepID=A0A0E0PJX3_ORYRU